MTNTLIRAEKEERNSISVVLPLKGEPIIVNQGKELTRTTITIAGEIPSSDGCSGIAMYGEEYSGEVSPSVVVQKFSGTPYATTTINCLG